MATLYTNHISGVLDAGISSGATVLESSTFVDLPTVASPDILWLVIDPEGTAGDPEVVKVTQHTGSSEFVTVTRGQQDSSARSHLISVPVVHATTAEDLTSFVADGGWQSFTPSWNELTIGNGSSTGRLRYITPKVMHVRARAIVGGTTTATLSPITLDVPDSQTASHGNGPCLGSVGVWDDSGSVWYSGLSVSTGDDNVISAHVNDGVGLSTAPVTGDPVFSDVGDELVIDIIIELD